MYVQLKKVVIIFIFLISIIFLLAFQNYQLKGTFYNILVVSNQEETSTESLTKVLWEQIEDLNTDEDILKYYTNINYRYLEVKNPQDLIRNLNEQSSSNDLIVIIGDSYNKYLPRFIEENPSKKIVLVESNSEIKGENVYKISLDWESIYFKVSEYIEYQYEQAIKNKSINKEDKLKVVYFKESKEDIKYEDFKEIISENIDLIPIEINQSVNDLNKEIKDYYNSGINNFINLNFEKQSDITKTLVSLQKDNINGVYNYNKNKEENDEVIYQKIKYLNIYNYNNSLGEYDYVINDESTTKNIIVTDNEIDYFNGIKKIILNEDYKKNIIISEENNGLIIKENSQGE